MEYVNIIIDAKKSKTSKAEWVLIQKYSLLLLESVNLLLAFQFYNTFVMLLLMQ